MRSGKYRIGIICVLLSLAHGLSGRGFGDSFETIIVYGDSRRNHEVHREVVHAITQRNPLAVFHTGDLVQNGRRSGDWKIFNEIVSDLRKRSAFYPALGNHEKDSSLYFDNFELPHNERWYSVDAGGIHFIVLDSNSDLREGSGQYGWLEKDLASAGSRTPVAALFHHPPYSTGTRREDEKGLRERIVPLFEEYGVDIVFNGHGHNYERSYRGGIHYIVTGGGGAPLQSQRRKASYSKVFIKDFHFCEISRDGEGLVVNVLTRELKVIDSFEVRNRASGE